MIESVEQLTGRQKAAVLMVGLGTEAAAQLFKELPEEEVESLAREVASLDGVPSEVIQQVMEEYHQMMLAQQYIAVGGLDYARDVLQNAVGEQRAAEVIRRVQLSLQVRGFNVLKQVDPNQLLSFIQKEHPQTIALVLTQLDPVQAAAVLNDLDEELRNDVMYRYATMERVSPETISTVEHVLESRIEFSEGTTQFGGVKAAAEILNLVGQSAEKAILENINEREPSLATEIKNLMFTFEDIVLLDDRDVQVVLRSLETSDLTLALKAASDEVKKKILSNMSERGATVILEEMEYMGQVRLRDVEAAQQRIVEIISRLEEEGEITISGEGEDVFV